MTRTHAWLLFVPLALIALASLAGVSWVVTQRNPGQARACPACICPLAAEATVPGVGVSTNACAELCNAIVDRATREARAEGPR